MSFSLIPIQNVQSVKDQNLEKEKRWYKNNNKLHDSERYLDNLQHNSTFNRLNSKAILAVLIEEMLISGIPDVLLIRCILKHFTQNLPEIIPILLKDEENLRLYGILHDQLHQDQRDVLRSPSPKCNSEFSPNQTEKLSSFNTEIDFKAEPCEVLISDDKKQVPDHLAPQRSKSPLVSIPITEMLEAVIKPEKEPDSRLEEPLLIDSAYSLSTEVPDHLTSSTRMAAPEQGAIGVDIYKISPRKNTQGLVSSLPRETSLKLMSPMPNKPTLKLVDLNSLLKDELKTKNALQQTTPSLEGARLQVNMDKRQIMNRYLSHETGRIKKKQKRKRKYKRSAPLPEESESTDQSTNESEESDMEIIDEDFRKQAETLPTRHNMARPKRRAANVAAKRTKKVVIESRISSSSSGASSSEEASDGSGGGDSELDKIDSDIDTVKEQEVTSRMKRIMQEKRWQKRKNLDARGMKTAERNKKSAMNGSEGTSHCSSAYVRMKRTRIDGIQYLADAKSKEKGQPGSSRLFLSDALSSPSSEDQSLVEEKKKWSK